MDDRQNSSWKQPAIDKDGRKLKTFHTMLALCYRGSRFNGSQIQKPEICTVEGELYKAMELTGMSAGRDFKNMSVTRCSRTDSGVSAALTVFTMFLADPASAMETVNKGLKELGWEKDLRCIGCQRVMPKFNAQKFCISRFYEYYCPESLFTYYPRKYLEAICCNADNNNDGIPNSEFKERSPFYTLDGLNSFYAIKEQFRNYVHDRVISANEMRYIKFFRVFFALETFHKYFMEDSPISLPNATDTNGEQSKSMFKKSFDENYIPKLSEEKRALLLDYICDPVCTYLEKIKKMDTSQMETPVPLREFVDFFSDYTNEVFCGLPARSFHNYTDIIKTNTLSGASRNIYSIKFGFDEHNKFLKIKIHGQSFMLHQIRRMMGTLMMTAHGFAMSCLIPGTLHQSSYLDSTAAIKQAGNGYGYKEKRSKAKLPQNNTEEDDDQKEEENDNEREEEEEGNTDNIVQNTIGGNESNKEKKEEEKKKEEKSEEVDEQTKNSNENDNNSKENKDEIKKVRYNLPTAPGCYLFLVKPDFGNFSKVPKNIPHGEFLPEQKIVMDASEKFIEEVIRPSILEEHNKSNPNIPYESVMLIDKCIKPACVESLNDLSFVNSTKNLIENIINNSIKMEERLVSLSTN